MHEIDRFNIWFAAKPLCEFTGRDFSSHIRDAKRVYGIHRYCIEVVLVSQSLCDLIQISTECVPVCVGADRNSYFRRSRIKVSAYRRRMFAFCLLRMLRRATPGCSLLLS
jgi:hypothetical protein